MCLRWVQQVAEPLWSCQLTSSMWGELGAMWNCIQSTKHKELLHLIALYNRDYCDVLIVLLVAELHGSQNCCDRHQIPSHSCPIGAIEGSRKNTVTEDLWTIRTCNCRKRQLMMTSVHTDLWYACHFLCQWQPCRSQEETQSCLLWDFAGWSRAWTVSKPQYIWRKKKKNGSKSHCNIEFKHCTGATQW